MMYNAYQKIMESKRSMIDVERALFTLFTGLDTLSWRAGQQVSKRADDRGLI